MYSVTTRVYIPTTSNPYAVGVYASQPGAEAVRESEIVFRTSIQVVVIYILTSSGCFWPQTWFSGGHMYVNLWSASTQCNVEARQRSTSEEGAVTGEAEAAADTLVPP